MKIDFTLIVGFIMFFAGQLMLEDPAQILVVGGWLVIYINTHGYKGE